MNSEELPTPDLPTDQASLLAARKSLIVTTAIACVLWASEGSDVNWAVTLTGIRAWCFLLAAHGYFCLMWVTHGGCSAWPVYYKRFRRDGIYRVGAYNSLMRGPFTRLLAVIGLLVIAGNLIFEWLPTPSSDAVGSWLPLLSRR